MKTEIQIIELRVNNYVYYKGKVCEVTAIFDEQRNTIELKGYKARIDLSRYNPPTSIPLVEQWLKNFGFKEWAEGNWKKYKDKNGWPSQWNYYLPYNNLELYVGNSTIQYVHQLQNLYFALTGKELTLKSTVNT